MFSIQGFLTCPLPAVPKSPEYTTALTAHALAIESKIPFMITHSPAHMFVTDRLAEEFAN